MHCTHRPADQGAGICCPREAQTPHIHGPHHELSLALLKAERLLNLRYVKGDGVDEIPCRGSQKGLISKTRKALLPTLITPLSPPVTHLHNDGVGAPPQDH